MAKDLLYARIFFFLKNSNNNNHEYNHPKNILKKKLFLKNIDEK